MTTHLQRPPCVLATGDSTGVSAEFPFGSRTSLWRIVTQESHLRLGHGALMLLKLPLQVPEGDQARRAVELNEAELSSPTNAHFLGSWCPDTPGLAFVSFWPNALYLEGLPTNLAVNASQRARWAARAHGRPWPAQR